MTRASLRLKLREFFLLKQSISEAGRIASTKGTRGVAQTQAARSLLASADSLQDMPDVQLATVTLLRQAAVFAGQALASRREIRVSSAEPSAVWNELTALPEVGKVLQLLSPDARSRVLQVIGAGLTPEHCERSLGELRALRNALFRVVRRIVSLLEDEILAPQRLRSRVVARWIGLVLVLSLPVGLAAYAIGRRSGKVNLARLAHVTMSSRFRPDIYEPEGLIDGNATRIGCHSEGQQEPWALFDLGGIETIHRVVITNRLDVAGDLAVPLVVQVSRDGKTFEQFARRDSDFKLWEATGTPTKAAYVRLIIPRLSVLHLNEVEIY